MFRFCYSLRFRNDYEFEIEFIEESHPQVGHFPTAIHQATDTRCVSADAFGDVSVSEAPLPQLLFDLLANEIGHADIIHPLTSTVKGCMLVWSRPESLLVETVPARQEDYSMELDKVLPTTEIKPARLQPREIDPAAAARRIHVTEDHMRHATRALHEEVMQGRTESHGVRCPACRQTAKVYRRKFNRSMARFLIRLVAKWQHDPHAHHVHDVGDFRGGEYAYSRHWGMIEAGDAEPGDTKSSGMWRPTDFGISIAKNHGMFLSHVLLYNNEALGHDGELIRISDVLNDPTKARHSYSELVREVNLKTQSN